MRPFRLVRLPFRATSTGANAGDKINPASEPVLTTEFASNPAGPHRDGRICRVSSVLGEQPLLFHGGTKDLHAEDNSGSPHQVESL
jgi:hypothetical protein